MVGVLAFLATPGSAMAFPDSGPAYDASASVYDGAAHSVEAHTGGDQPRTAGDVSEGVQGTVATAAGHLSVLLPVSVAADSGAWSLPAEGGGLNIGGRWYTEHALERMAPNTPEVMAQLEARAMARAQAEGLTPGTREFGEWWADNGPKPRGIPTMVVEAEIANPGTTGVEVITNANGDVVTVWKTG
jgi:hypothetical protein